MNINQMKASIAKFRKADLSVIKDEKLRAKGHKLQAKQKGFTLLELLVVIALLAVIATGALIAYENVGDNAQAAAGANSAATIDRAIRTYKAVEGNYPNQWDNLAVDSAASAVPFLPEASLSFLAAWDTSAATSASLRNAFVNAGIEELQTINGTGALDPDVSPNRAHNESTNPGDGVTTGATEVEMESPDNELPGFLSVIPNKVCNFESYPTNTFDNTSFTSNQIQNSYADLLEGDECHAVVALGFGGDAAASTALSNVAIAQSPTYARQGVVNPEEEYSRFIGLFLVGTEDEDNAGQWEYLESARLLAVIATDGENIDSLNALAAAGQSGGDDD
ncbi:MAG: prepilin-type N-terminal cleavage/methylation domain-containing protein [Methylophaga sp.]|nr:prepilin-type N-terminal cleavage/methylation domain-containing protein [Methylophaga sp.]